MAKYELESSPIWDDVLKVMNSGSKPVKFEYKAQIHTVKDDITVLKVTKIDLLRDYNNNIGDHMQVEMTVPLGDYMLGIFPYRTNLEFTFKKITLTEGGDSKKKNTIITTKRYKAVFLLDQGGAINPIVSGGDLDQVDYQTLNNIDIVTLRLELLDRSLEPLRIKEIEGSTFRNVTMKQLIVNIFSGESQKVTVDGKPAIDGVDMVEPDNVDLQSNIMIGDGVQFASLPTYLQEKAGGVYSAGIGTYLQTYNEKNVWFIYPLYNSKLFDTSKNDKAVIYALPQDRFPGLDRTYHKDGSILSILATSAKKYRDSADTDFMNDGSGFRMADARAYMGKPVEITEDGPKGVRTRLNHESVVEDRKDGLNYAPAAKISGNPFVHYTNILARQLARVDLTWENADPDLIYPGMPVTYVYLENDRIVELKGEIQFVQSYTELQSRGTMGNIYKNVCALVLMVNQISTENTVKNRKPSTFKGIGDF